MGNALCCFDEKRNYEINSQGFDDYTDLGEDSIYVKASSSTNNEEFTQNQVNQSQSDFDVQDKKDKEKQFDQEDIKEIIDDHLSDFELDIDKEQEIQEFAHYRNSNESELKFSQKDLAETIDNLITKEQSEDEAKKWELKLNKNDVKVFIKKGGSHLNENMPYIKTEVLFNSYFQMHKIIKAIYQGEHRQKWDKNILKYEVTPLIGSNAVLTYQLNKAPLNFQNRDFIDKHLKFSYDNKFYCYYSSVPNDTEIKEIPDKVGRAINYIGIQKLERLPEDGKIKLTMFMQCDLKMNVTPKLIGMFLPQGMQDWSRKINKYLNDNYDNIN